MNKKQYEEAGKLFIDLGKYLITAIFFGQFFSETIHISFSLLMAAPIMAVLFIYLGLRLLGTDKDTTARNVKPFKNNTSKIHTNKQSKKQQ